MIVMITAFGLLTLLSVASFSKGMTLEEKRIENAMFAMAGEEPPHKDVPLNHNVETLHDMLMTSVKEVKASHVGHDSDEVHIQPVHPAGEYVPPYRERVDDSGSHGFGGNMNMWFHSGYDEVILFEVWRIRNPSELAVSCFVIFIMGALYEGLKWFRVYLALIRKPKRKESFHLPTVVTVTDGRQLKEGFTVSSPLMDKPKNSSPEARRPGPFSLMGITQAVLYILQLVLAYWLMLIVMTYNIWLCLSVVLGAGFGYWISAGFCLSHFSAGAIDSLTTDACH